MPPKQRQVRMESRGSINVMQKLETRSDEELKAETRYRAAAQALLGARAAERMDAKAAREHFRVAIAAARPQERLQLRRMAEASIALAERRAGDLKVAAAKLGQTPPTNRQLLMLRLMGVIAPPQGAPLWLRVRGVALVALAVVALIVVGFGIVKLVALPFGGVGDTAWFWGFLLVVAVIAVMAVLGRRRQRAARAKATEQKAAAFGGTSRATRRSGRS